MAEQGLPVTVRIQARLQDDQRAEVIDALFEALLARVSPPSRVTGSELVVGVHGEPRAVLAHLEVAPVDAERVVAAILDLEDGLPQGSRVEINGASAPFGRLQGLAVYLNGTQLDADAYAQGDLQATVDALTLAAGDAGTLWSHWMGPRRDRAVLLRRRRRPAADASGGGRTGPAAAGTLPLRGGGRAGLSRTPTARATLAAWLSRSGARRSGNRCCARRSSSC
jgi:hypothetical protein